MLIDTHCHLDASEFDDDRDEQWRIAREAGVHAVVVPSVGRVNFATVRSLAHALPGGHYALGIHPLFVEAAHDDDLRALREEVAASLDDPRFVGVGEIGLDHFVPGLDRARQERYYVEQLRIAREHELPVILHVRRAQDAVLKQLRRLRPAGGIAHAFNGSPQQAHAYLDLGFALGFGGELTFERALRIRRLVRELPAHAHVLETDAPDIPPAWVRPGRNSPAQLPAIARVFARLREQAPAEVAAVTGQNARRVLPRLARVG